MRAAVLVLAATSVAACLLPARQFSVTLDGDGIVDDLPVTVEDRTGLVHAVGPAQPGQLNFQEGVAAGSDPSELVISWIGGACDHRTHLVFDAADGGYSVLATTDADGTCDLGGFLRTVTIQVAAPIDPGSVSFEHHDRTR